MLLNLKVNILHLILRKTMVMLIICRAILSRKIKLIIYKTIQLLYMSVEHGVLL